MGDAAENITQLLKDYGAGDREALEKLYPQVYHQLHQLAARYMNRERPGHTLQPTALVNEAFVRLVGGKQVDWQDRTHFFAVSARIMRHLLTDHAKAKRAEKRGGGDLRVSFDEKFHQREDNGPDLLHLDEALRRLEKIDERQARVVELRYFGGLSVEETAQVLKTSPATVKRDWKVARLWLYRELSESQK